MNQSNVRSTLNKRIHKDLQAHLGAELLRHDLIQTALTHRSADVGYDNERLEFLGDAVLGFLIANILYRRFETAAEGMLTRWRAHLVRRETLADVAQELHMPEMLIVGAGEERHQGRQKPSLLANSLEAVIGAIYLLEGEQRARQFIEDVFAERIESLPAQGDLKDPKTRLQEWLQKENLPLPTYTSSDPKPGKLFQVHCEIQALDVKTSGQARSKNKASQDAAQKALDAIAQM